MADLPEVKYLIKTVVGAYSLEDEYGKVLDETGLKTIFSYITNREREEGRINKFDQEFIEAEEIEELEF